MSSSSASRSDGRESEPSLLVVDESPFFKMVEDGASCKLQDVLRIPKTLTRDGRVVIPGGSMIKSANPVHCDVNNDPYSSGLGLSGNFSVPLSDHEGGSLTRPSTRVEILCMTLALFGHYLNYLNKAKGKVSVCSNSNMNACIHTGGSIAPCVPRRQGVGALE